MWVRVALVQKTRVEWEEVDLVEGEVAAHARLRHRKYSLYHICAVQHKIVRKYVESVNIIKE